MVHSGLQSSREALAADSMADPDLAAASGPALVALLQSVAAMEARLHALDQQIAKLACTSVDQKTKALIETIPGFGPVNAAKTLAWLPTEILHSGSNRKVAARLQAFMGNDPRLRQSGQRKGHTKMSKRGVEMLRTAFFQSAFTALITTRSYGPPTSATAPKAKRTRSL